MIVIHFLGKIISSILIGLVRLYQWVLSPILPNACRYQPTCSHYMVEAIKVHGPLYGTWLGLKRISRCHPWGGYGKDPVPPPKQKKKEIDPQA